MLLEDMARFIPREWSPMNIMSKKVEMIEVPEGTSEHKEITSRVLGEYNMGPLYRIQNPLLFTKFCMKSFEYEMKGDYQVLSLYHDTIQANVESIVTYNIDWRYGERFMYGPGVYFSTSSYRAHRRSNNELGPERAMFLVNVLVGKTQVARRGEFLPDPGYDTMISPDGETYIKYFDHEYYPTYVQYYTDS